MITHATPLADWVVILPVILCLVGGALLLMLRGIVRVQLWICLAVLLLVLVCDGVLFDRVISTGPLSMTMRKWGTSRASAAIFASIEGPPTASRDNP